MDANPFSVSSLAPLERGVFAEHAVRKRATFLYRHIRFEKPFQADFIYSGWWFRQRVKLDEHVCWYQISWLTIRPRFEFELPEMIELPCEALRLVVDDRTGPETRHSSQSSPRKVSVEIDFSRGLMIRRFRIWLGGRILYDEIS